MKMKYEIIMSLGMVALLATGCGKQASTGNTGSASSNSAASVAGASTHASDQKFVDQAYYQYAYLISGGNLSADAKLSLTGFSMGQQTLANGNTQITLKALKAGYQDQQFTLQPGQQLYFIERNLKDDDQGADQDGTLLDDMAVVVDGQGNVVGQPGGWTAAPSTNP